MFGRRCATTCATPAPCASTTSWAAAPVLDPGGRAGRGRLCALPVRRPRAHHRARVGAPSLRGDRRGSRHGAARLPAGDAARGHDVVPGALLRARAGRRVCPPEAYPRQALVSVSTHDLPTLRGFWTARDVDGGELLGRFPDEAAPDARPNARATGFLLRHPTASDCCPRASIRSSRRTSCPTSWRSRCIAISPPLPATWSWSSWRTRSARRSSRTCPAPSSMPTGAAGSGAAGGGACACLGRRIAAAMPAAGRSFGVAMAPPIVPRATYRLQFHKVRVRRCARHRAVPRRARREPRVRFAAHHGAAGSNHGYDVIDFNRLNPELGDEAAFEP